MFCPVCRDEYRKGFTRCATCEVDLVESLDAGARPIAPPPQATAAAPASRAPAVEMTVPFCGFLALEEARRARDTLRGKGVRAVIVITEPHDAEEFWLRVTPADVKATAAILGPPEEIEVPDESFLCSACGATVGPSDRACPGCGLEFAE